jgi:hypothetical protein
VAFDEAALEAAGIKGRQNAAARAIPVKVRFVSENMLDSTSREADIETHFAKTIKLHFRSGFSAHRSPWLHGPTQPAPYDPSQTERSARRLCKSDKADTRTSSISRKVIASRANEPLTALRG